MTVKPLVARGNVDAGGRVIDPQRVRHGALRAGRVCGLAGEVDPQTHLNRDFASHRVDECVVVEALEEGAPVLLGEQGYRLAAVGADALSAFGLVDVGARRTVWLATLRGRREERTVRAATNPVKPTPT